MADYPLLHRKLDHYTGTGPVGAVYCLRSLYTRELCYGNSTVMILEFHNSILRRVAVVSNPFRRYALCLHCDS